MEDPLLELEDCINIAKQNTVKIRISITVASGIGMLVGMIVVVVMLSAKAYKSFLQRIIFWLTLLVLFEDMCRVASVYHRFCYGETIIMVLKDKACEILGFITIWTYWCIYMFLIVIILYLPIIVVLQTRDDSVIVAKFRNSHLLQVILEVSITLGVLFGPGLVLWVPYHENQYGFDGVKCGLKPANYSDRSEKDDVIISVFNYTNIELTGVVAILALLLLSVVYHTISAKLLQVKRAIKNIFIFLAGVIGYVVIYNILTFVILKLIKGGYQLAIFSVCFAVVGKFVLLVGYLLAFHFSKLCAPIRKLLRSKAIAVPLLQGVPQDKKYDSVKEAQPSESATQSTFFDVPYTGQFTAITNE